jgi:hypothetical protein
VAFLALLLLAGCNKSPTTQGGEGEGDGNEVPAEGSLDLATEEVIAGWAWDTTKPDTPIKVDLFDGDKKLDTVLADQFREDLVPEKKGNGKHGFNYTTPDSLKDGKSHTIRAKVNGTNIELSGSPKTLKVP